MRACKKSAPFDPIWLRLARLALLAKFCPVRPFCQTPNLVLGLGVDFTFPYNNNNNNDPHLIFHIREGTRGLRFGTQS